MRALLMVALLGAIFATGCGRDTTGSPKDRGPAVGDKSPPAGEKGFRASSPTTGNKGATTPAPSR